MRLAPFFHGRVITKRLSCSGNGGGFARISVHRHGWSLRALPDVARGNHVITRLCEEGRMTEARKLFDAMPVRNVMIWTCMILGYKQVGMNEMGLRIFRDMLSDGVSRPNRDMFVCVLDAISDLSVLFEGLQVHQMVIKTRFESDSFVRSALVNMYGKCGEIGIAQKVFNLSSQRDLVSWNGLLSAYPHNRRNGNEKEATKSHEKMNKIRLRPNEAKKLINGLKIGTLSRFSIDTFLNGLNLHPKGEINNSIENKLLEVENKLLDDAGSYTLLSNIYASAGKYKEAAKIRARMNERGLKKQPGCSWIEIGSRVHVFVVRDKSHCETDAIYRLVHDIHGFMRMDGQIFDVLIG
ncbi:hypothetical protein LUZ60_002166 [Juncus effusus]|nr:hypothetical protein LUZ60_002166 [Juncus effusus]